MDITSKYDLSVRLDLLIAEARIDSGGVEKIEIAWFLRELNMRYMLTHSDETSESWKEHYDCIVTLLIGKGVEVFWEGGLWARV